MPKLYNAIQNFVTETEQHIQSLADALGVDENDVNAYLDVLSNEIFEQE